MDGGWILTKVLIFVGCYMIIAFIEVMLTGIQIFPYNFIMS
jgi:hypothetical protein